jgi:hypothetical protein
MPLKPLKILGIYRLPMFSNNAIEVDRLILEESIAALQRISPIPLNVEMVEEPNLYEVKGAYDLVLTMAQSETALQEIQKKFPEENVWNSATAVRNCYRKTMSNALIGLDVNYVPFQILPTDGSVKPVMKTNQSYWLKRSDFHAIADEDVSLAETPTEAQEKLRRFHERGVSEVILQPHIHGDIYKFYGVKGKFFRALKVRDFLKSTAVPEFTGLKTSVNKSADELGLLIYGGDAILDEAGKFHLIDLNDWPSFRICRPEASQAIAELVNDHLVKKFPAKIPALASSSGQI